MPKIFTFLCQNVFHKYVSHGRPPPREANLAPNHHPPPVPSHQIVSKSVRCLILCAQHEKFILNQYNKTSDITSKTQMCLIRGYVWLRQYAQRGCMPARSFLKTSSLLHPTAASWRVSPLPVVHGKSSCIRWGQALGYQMKSAILWIYSA